MENTEIELKFPLLNKEELAKKLDSAAKKGKTEEQKDTYYTPPHRNFLAAKPVSEWLRIRESKSGASLNYKKWHNANGSKTTSCDEYETGINDVVALKKTFKPLGMRELTVVDKTRRTWNYKDTEIAIDEVKELGDYIEVEAKRDFGSIDAAKQHLQKVLAELGAKTGEQDYEGYPYLLLKKKGLI